MNKKLFIILFCLSVLLVSMVSGVKPLPITQNNNGLNGLELRVGLFEPLKLHDNHTFNAHIFNGLDGLGLRNDTDINCSFHLYNEQGDHIHTAWEDEYEHTWDIEFPVNGSYFNYVGEYAFILQCECTGCGLQAVDLGGFVSQTFTVTETGFSYDDMKPILLILAMVGVACILLFIYVVIDKEHVYLKILLLFFTMFIIFIIGAFISNPFNYNIHFTFYKLILTIVYSFILYVFIYFIYTVFQHFEDVGKERGWKR